jgi:hypothetical protein
MLSGSVLLKNLSGVDLLSTPFHLGAQVDGKVGLLRGEKRLFQLSDLSIPNATYLLSTYTIHKAPTYLWVGEPKLEGVNLTNPHVSKLLRVLLSTPLIVLSSTGNFTLYGGGWKMDDLGNVSNLIEVKVCPLCNKNAVESTHLDMCYSCQADLLYDGMDD